jgi:hypothetical protein
LKLELLSQSLSYKFQTKQKNSFLFTWASPLSLLVRIWNHRVPTFFSRIHKKCVFYIKIEIAARFFTRRRPGSQTIWQGSTLKTHSTLLKFHTTWLSSKVQTPPKSSGKLPQSSLRIYQKLYCSSPAIGSARLGWRGRWFPFGVVSGSHWKVEATRWWPRPPGDERGCQLPSEGRRRRYSREEVKGWTASKERTRKFHPVGNTSETPTCRIMIHMIKPHEEAGWVSVSLQQAIPEVRFVYLKKRKWDLCICPRHIVRWWQTFWFVVYVEASYLIKDNLYRCIWKWNIGLLSALWPMGLCSGGAPLIPAIVFTPSFLSVTFRRCYIDNCYQS